MYAGKAYKSVFCTTWLINFFLCLLVAWILFKGLAAPTVPPFFITFSISTILIFFIAKTVSYILLALSDRSGFSIVTSIFILFEIICVTLGTVAIFISRRYEPFVLFNRAPIEWLQNRRFIVAIFTALFIVIFIVQLFSINRYATIVKKDSISSRTYEAARRKATPYHNNKEVLSLNHRF
uniref:Uncharacterized protein n=1 Tax=Panagrolaimus sp. PS1159 TaxID=55785 RepID=A0AC35FYI6_9BILA